MVGGVIVGTAVLMWGQSCPDVVDETKKRKLTCIALIRVKSAKENCVNDVNNIQEQQREILLH